MNFIKRYYKITIHNYGTKEDKKDLKKRVSMAILLMAALLLFVNKLLPPYVDIYFCVLECVMMLRILALYIPSNLIHLHG